MNNAEVVSFFLQDGLLGRPIKDVLLTNQSGAALRLFSRRKFINQFKFLLKEIELEYLGSEISFLGKFKQLLKVALTLNSSNIVRFVRNLLFAYEIQVPRSFMLDAPVKLTSEKYPRFWISRCATIAGIQTIGLSRIYEYNLIRERFMDRVLVWGDIQEHNDVVKQIPINQFFPSQKLKSISLIQENSWIQKRFSNAEVIGGNILIVNRDFVPTNHRVPKGDTSWPSDYPTLIDGNLLMSKAQRVLNIDEATFAGHSHSWFHFIVEFIPVLNRIPKDLRRLPIVIPEGSPNQILDLYKIMGFERIVPLKPWESLKASNLNVTLDLRKIPFTDFSQNGLDLLATQNVISAFLPSVSSKPNRKIYLKRETNLLRGLENQSEIDSYLKNCGFDSILPSKLSLKEQIILISESCTVVAESGAALTSLIFAQHSLNVIELQPYFPVIENLWMDFATTLGHSYGKVQGRKTRVGRLMIDSRSRIQISELQKLLSSAGL